MLSVTTANALVTPLRKAFIPFLWGEGELPTTVLAVRPQNPLVWYRSNYGRILSLPPLRSSLGRLAQGTTPLTTQPPGISAVN